MGSILLNLLRPRTTVYPGRYFVTTKSVTGWLQCSDATAVPTWIGAVSAQVGQAICAVSDDVCIGSNSAVESYAEHVGEGPTSRHRGAGQQGR
jgi:hypothetical protein